MQTIRLSLSQPQQLPPCVATLGFFDGLHLGHRFLIGRVTAEARTLGLPSAVVTFDRHPREVLHQDYLPELLTTLNAKLQLMAQTGVDIAVVLHFDCQMAALSAHDFMARVLRAQLNVEKLVIGYDNRFGHNRAEGLADYVRHGHALGMEVEQCPAFELDGIQVSSSVVRSLLKEGEVELAARCLGRPYALRGTVVHGYSQGRRMGFPTANLVPTLHQLVPANGVYAVRATIEGQPAPLPAMTNIGTRPTFGGTQRTVETHVFGLQANLYGRPLTLAFEKRIRSERRFDNVGQLVDQLKDDERLIQQYFNTTQPHEH